MWSSFTSAVFKISFFICKCFLYPAV